MFRRNTERVRRRKVGGAINQVIANENGRDAVLDRAIQADPPHVLGGAYLHDLCPVEDETGGSVRGVSGGKGHLQRYLVICVAQDPDAADARWLGRGLKRNALRNPVAQPYILCRISRDRKSVV